MSIVKKIIFCIGWIVVFIVTTNIIQALHLTTSKATGLASLARLTAYLLLLCLFMLAPLVFAVLVWFGKPKRFYKGLVGKASK
jgi:type IV secretory pathway TrbL component